MFCTRLTIGAVIILLSTARHITPHSLSQKSLLLTLIFMLFSGEVTKLYSAVYQILYLVKEMWMCFNLLVGRNCWKAEFDVCWKDYRLQAPPLEQELLPFRSMGSCCSIFSYLYNVCPLVFCTFVLGMCFLITHLVSSYFSADIKKPCADIKKPCADIKNPIIHDNRHWFRRVW